MTTPDEIARFIPRAGTVADWTARDPKLELGEEGYVNDPGDADDGKHKVGDGTSLWSELDYVTEGGGGSGTVSSVNTVDPDGTGNVSLTADDIPDGTTNKAYTATEQTKLAAITGTNTGDETSATIKSKLGVTTLSGSNTGDETTATIKSKLSITTLSGSNTGDQTTITGNAATATKLATARNINGVAFDGTAAITVADSTKVPTTTTVNGHALSANVTLTASDVSAAAASTATTVTVSSKTANYTLIAGDAGTIIEVNSSSALTVTVPASVFSAGQIVEVCQYGTGQVTVAAGSGVTLRNASSLKTRAQYSSLSIRFRSASEAIVSGDMA